MITRTIDQTEQPLCCHGCAGAVDWIQSQGLGSFYHYRETKAPKPEQQTHWSLFDHPEFLEQHTIALDDGHLEIELSIPQIRCAACTWLLERVLQSNDGVIMSHAHLGRQTLTVRWDPQIASLASILGQIDRLGYTATLLTVVRTDIKLAADESLSRGSMRAMMQDSIIEDLTETRIQQVTEQLLSAINAAQTNEADLSEDKTAVPEIAPEPQPIFDEDLEPELQPELPQALEEADSAGLELGEDEQSDEFDQ